MNIEKVGKYISELRKKEGLTQEELAEKIGVNSKTISKWETGINIPDTVCLFELSKVFNVSVQDILNGERIKDSSTDDSKTFINGINFYYNSFKRKYILILCGIVLFICVIFSLFYTISNYNKIQLYDIKSENEEYSLEGYLVINHDESIFILNNISNESEMIGTDLEQVIKEYSICIKNDKSNETIYSIEETLENYSRISEVLNNIKISFSIDNSETLNENKNSFYLLIQYTNKNDERIESIVNIQLEKHFSNNKLIY